MNGYTLFAYSAHCSKAIKSWFIKSLVQILDTHTNSFRNDTILVKITVLFSCRDRYQSQQTWQRLGIPGPKSSSLIFGNFREIMTRVLSKSELYTEQYVTDTLWHRILWMCNYSHRLMILLNHGNSIIQLRTMLWNNLFLTTELSESLSTSNTLGVNWIPFDKFPHRGRLRR